MFAQNFLVIVRIVLTTTVAMENAAPRRGLERDGRFQRPDCQIPFHAITDGPADHAPGAQATTSVMGRAMARLFDAWPEVAAELASMSNPAAIADRLADEQKRVMGKIYAEFMADAAARSARPE